MPRQPAPTGLLAAHARAIIGDLMRNSGTSIAELAEILEVDEAVVRRVLIPGSNPTLATVERMIEALGGTVALVSPAP